MTNRLIFAKLKGDVICHIARFFGILIKMYYREHGVPHFHAIYGEFNEVFEIATLEMIDGDPPLRHNA